MRGVRLVVRPHGDGHAAISPEALRAIVGNLADNAVKHMGTDGAERLVELSCESRPGEVEITVRDTGVGIPPEVLPRVWDHFFRATDRPGGLGIGLRTVKRLVDAHRGRIEVESHVGRGSRFTVVLPAAPAPQPQAPAAEVAEGARDAT
jgi:signal transduction histidine kinase